MRPIPAFGRRKFFKDSELLNTILPNNKLFPRDPFGRSDNNEISPGSQIVYLHLEIIGYCSLFDNRPMSGINGITLNALCRLKSEMIQRRIRINL